MRLPVSGLDVTFRLPDGHDDLAIVEGSAGARYESGVEARRTLLMRGVDALSRLAIFVPREHVPGAKAQVDSAVGVPGLKSRPISEASLSVMRELNSPILGAGRSAAGDFSADGETPGWDSLTITDFEHGLLGLRRFLFGDRVSCLFRCPCSERMEVEFSVGDLLHDAQPGAQRRVVASATRPGWFTVPGKSVIFRLPTVGDQLDALASDAPCALLEGCCIERAARDGRVQAVVERAMEAMAPAVSRPVAGVCAACGAVLSLDLDVPTLVLDELAASAAGIHREIHAIAATYHWPEATILALPQIRRQAYTEAIFGGAA